MKHGAVPLAVFAAVLLFYCWQTKRENELEEEIQTLSESQIIVSSPPTILTKSPNDENAPTKPNPSFLRYLSTPLLAEIAVSGKEGAAKLFPRLEEDIAELTDAQLVALVCEDPTFEFRHHYIVGKEDYDWIHARIIYQALDRLFKTDPRKALQITLDSGAGRKDDSNVHVHNFIRDGLGRWAQRDLDAAWQWLETHGDTLWNHDLKRHLLLQGLAETSPREAIEKARLEDMLPEALRYISQVVHDQDGRVALFEAVDAVESSADREGFYWSYIDRLQDIEGFEAAREFAEEAISKLGNDSWDNAVVLKVALNHIIDRPEKKAAWLAEHSSPENLRENLSRFVSVWTLRDPQAAAAWLELRPSIGQHEE